MKIIIFLSILLFSINAQAQIDIFQSVRNNDTIALKEYILAKKNIDTLNNQFSNSQ